MELKIILSKKFIWIGISGLAVILALSIGYYFYFSKNRPSADSGPDGLSYYALTADNTTSIQDMNKISGSRMMGWWQPYLSWANPAEGRVAFAMADSGSNNTTWLRAVSIYPTEYTMFGDIKLNICVFDSQPSTSNCSDYNFIKMNQNPWTFRFSPSSDALVGRYAIATLSIKPFVGGIGPKIPMRMSLEYKKPPYSELVSWPMPTTAPHMSFSSTLSEPRSVKEASIDLVKMADEYYSITGTPLPIASGFRSMETQAYLYAHKESFEDPVAPCTSWHESGLAVDLNLVKIGQPNYDNIIKVIAPKYGWELVSTIWGASEDHHMNYIAGRTYYGGNRGDAILGVTGSVCVAQ